MSRRDRGVIALLFVLLLIGPAEGVETQLRVDRGMESFAKGTLEGVSINLEGWLRLAPRQEELARLESLFVWDLAVDSKGNVYAGTGDGAVVYRIDRQGELSEWPLPDEMNVHALAVDSKDVVYAGTSPNGLIFRIDPDGEAKLVHRTGAVYVWDLLVDEDDCLLAALGKEGAVRRIPPEGKAETLYRTEDAHVLCLEADRQGGVLAGTSPSGHVLKLHGAESAALLLDAAEPDIWGIARDEKGRVFAVTASGGPGRPDQAKNTQGSAPQSSSGSKRQPGENSVYMIEPDEGRSLRVLGVKHTGIFAAACLGSNGLYIGTGDDGNLLRVSPEYGLELLLDLPERQILCMACTGEGDLLIGTGNGAAVYRISQRFRTTGEYLSEPTDSRWGARWGKLSWIGRARKGEEVTFSTRSGNTAQPDHTWSAWEEVEDLGSGQGKVVTRGGRYLQYRVALSTSDREQSPVIESVTITYLPHNLPPKLKEVKVDDTAPKSNKGGNSGQGASGRPRTVVKLSWTAEDPNEDRLSYELRFRREGDPHWTVFARNLDKPSYSWDTSLVPDGGYRVLVRATDAPSNPGPTAAATEKVTQRIVIDNTRPRIQWLKGSACEEGIRLRGTAMDESSDIVRIEYSIEDADWRAILPEDGMFDSRMETFDFVAEVAKPGQYYVRVRATDRKGNTRVERVLCR